MELTGVSLTRLQTCDPRLIGVMTKAAKYLPIMIVCGHRDQAAQDAAFESHTSKTPWPQSKHNSQPSLAVDFAPLKPDGTIDWNNTKSFVYMAGWILAFGAAVGIKLRSGADWNGNRLIEKGDDWDPGHIEVCDV